MAKLYPSLLRQTLAFLFCLGCSSLLWANGPGGPGGRVASSPDVLALPLAEPTISLNYEATDYLQIWAVSAQHLVEQGVASAEYEGEATSAAPPWGHAKCVIRADTNCANRTVTLGAFQEFLFNGITVAVTAPWSTGVTAHSIVVSTPGFYTWNTTGFTCDHFNNTIEINEFFAGTITVTGPPALCPGLPGTIEVDVSPAYSFPEFKWTPPNPSGELTPYQFNKPGTYTLLVEDEMKCPFTKTIVIPPSPPVLPVLSTQPIMCPDGDTAVITITPNFTAYEWEHGGNTNPIEVYEPGYYTVIVTNQFGCTAEKSIAIQNGAAGVPPIFPFRPAICPGQLDTLLVNGPYSKYEWSTGQTGFRVVINQPGTYTVTVTNFNGCTNSNEITIGQLPTPTIGLNSTPLCPGSTATLSVTGGPFPLYKWSPGQTSSTITVNAPGTYSITVSGGGICPTSTSVVVAQAPAPLANIAPPGLLTCVSPSLLIDATASSSGSGFQASWTTVGGHFVSGQNTLTPTVDSAGTYILTVTNTLNGCITQDTVVVSRNVAPPNVNPGSPATLTCQTTVLSIGQQPPLPGPNFEPIWTTQGGNFTSATNVWNPTVNQPGTYTLTVLNNQNGCTATASVTIAQNTLAPTALIPPHGILTCTEKTVTLSSAGSSTGGNFTYTWTTPNGTIEGATDQPTAVVSSIGNYNLLVTNTLTGCTSTASTAVTSDANIPTVAAAPPAMLTCLVKNVTIDATGSSSGSNFTYTWTTSGGNIQSGGNTLTPVVTLPGAYTLTLLNTANNCVAVLTVQVPQDVAAPTANAGPNSTLSCTATSLVLDGSASSVGSNFTYLWTTTNGNITAGAATIAPTVNKSGTYLLTVTNLMNGCTSTASVQVLDDAATPFAVIAQPKVLTCTTLQTPLDATASSQGNSYTYLWEGNGVTGQTTNQVTVNQPGTYTITVTNTQNGCTDVETVTVTQDVALPTALAGPDLLLNCFKPTASVGDAANGGANFTLNWTTLDGNFTTPTNGPTAGIDRIGTYTLLITNTQNGCTDTDDVTVTEDFAKPAADAGPGTELNCVLTEYTVQGTGSAGAIFTYQWTTVGGNIKSGANTLTPTVDKAGTYNLLVSNTQNGCTSTASVALTINTTLPTAAIALPKVLTCTTLQTPLDATASSQNGPFNYLWAGSGIVSGQGTLTLTVNQPGPYTITVTNTQNGCTDVETLTVTQDVALPTALAGPDVLLNCFQPTATVGDAANSGAIFTLNWTTLGGNFTTPTSGPTAGIDRIGTYTLLITNTQNGCTDTDDVTVTEDFAKPAANAGPGTELNCVLTEYTLQGTGSTGAIFKYQWTTVGGNIKSGANTLTPLVDGAGTYNLLVSNTQNGCTSTASVQITQSADVPIAVAGLPQTLTCTLNSTALNGAGSTGGPTYTYTWTTLDGNIVSGANTLTPTIDKPGTYAIQVLNTANNCKATSSVVINQNIQPPVVDAGAQQTLNCSTLSLPLQATVQTSASQNLAYAWGTANGQILSGGNTSKPTVGSAGTYTVTVTDALNGCTGTDEAIVANDVDKPVAAIAAPQTLTCATLQIPLSTATSSAGSNFVYAWTTQGGNFVSLQDPKQPIVNQPGIYNLTITNTLNNCTTTASATVPQDVQLPTAEAGPTKGLDCDDLTLALNGVGSSTGSNFTYNWATTGGQILTGGTTLTPQVGQPGLYVLTVKNTLNGCTKTDEVTVTQDIAKPLVAIAPPALLTCLVKTAPLTGSGTGFGSAPTFAWAASGGGNILGGTNALQAVANQPGTYTLTVQNTQNACTSSVTVEVKQNIAPPPVQVKPAPRLTCTVKLVDLEALVPPQTQLLWTTQNGSILGGNTTPKPQVDEPGLYLLTVTSTLNGCTSTEQVPVEREQNIPTGLKFKLRPPLCTGELGKLMVEQVQGGIGPFRYSIDGGQTFFPPKDFEKIPPGNFTLVIQDVNGCEVEEPVTVPPPPKPLVNLPPLFTLELGENQELKALVPPNFPLALIDTVLWTPMTGLTFSGNTVPQLLNPTAQPFVNTEYQVTIVTPEGCKATARTIIRVEREPSIYAPNVIKPHDADGDNSTFLIFAKDESVLQIKTLNIYDRWGNLVFFNENFQPNDSSKGWKGDFRGSIVNPAVFAWWAEVELIDGRTVLLKGDVTVLR